MTTGEEPVRIIGNESNMIYEIEPGNNVGEQKKNLEEDKSKELPVQNDIENKVEQTANNDLATNDGAVIETLDTAFHNKPGVSEGVNPSGSDRADYYEQRSNGKSDADEEKPADIY